MFKTGAVYKAADVMDLVIQKTDDNRVADKRLLRGLVEVSRIYTFYIPFLLLTHPADIFTVGQFVY